jgi:hypothetical protein
MIELLSLWLMAMSPEGVAVLAYPAGDAQAQAAAASARASLAGRALSTTKIDERLRGILSLPMSDANFDAQLAAVDAAFAAGNVDAYAALVDRSFAELAADEGFTTTKMTRLESARVLAAQRLLGLAGPSEKGKGETKLGQRGKALLRDAVRANPTLTLAPDQHPPKLIALLATAANEVRRGPQATLTVTGVTGIDVFIEGRNIGKAPMTSSLPAGSYRVWGELGGARSRLRVLSLPTDAHVDLIVDPAFDTSLKAGDGSTGPGLTADASVLTPAYLDKLRSMLGADVLLLSAAQGEHPALLAMFSSATRTERMAVRTDDVPATSVTLASVLIDQRATTGLDVDNNRLPALFFAHAGLYAAPADAPAVASADEGEPFPWLLLGGVAGGVAVVAAAGVTGLVLWLQRPPVVLVGQKYCLAGSVCE